MARKKVTRKGNCKHNDPDTTNYGGDQFKKLKFGDVAWVRTTDRSWWPAQVVDEESVNFNPKKKPKTGVLVRIYGGSEYLYVDPVKCRIEFGNFLKQENINMREAFEKALEKDLFRVRSGGKSKRKVSELRDIAATDAHKGKRPRKCLTERIEVEDPTTNLGAFSSEYKEEVASGKGKNKPRANGIRAKKSQQGETTKPKVFKRTRGGALKVHGIEQGSARKLNITEKAILGTKKFKETSDSNVKEASYGRVSRVKQTSRHRASIVMGRKGRTGKTNVKGKASRETFKTKGTNDGGASKIKGTHRRGASKVKAKAQLGKGKLYVKRSREAVKVKGTSHCRVSKSKKTHVCGASRVKGTKKGGTGMSNVKEKASPGTSKAKRSSRAGVSNVKGTPYHRSSRVVGVKQGAGKSKRKEKSTRETSKVKETSRGRVSRIKETPLCKAPKILKTLKVRSKVIKTKFVVKQELGKNRLATKASKANPKTRVSKWKTKNSREQRKEKFRNVISKKGQKGMIGKANISEKVKTGIRRSKVVKQNGLVTLNYDNVREHAQRKSSSIAKCSALEQSTPNFSGRRTKVMQRLGLIAPLGSPFHRNELYIAF